MSNIIIFIINILLAVFVQVQTAHALPSQIPPIENINVGQENQNAYYIDPKIYDITSKSDLINYYLRTSSCTTISSYSEIADPAGQALFLHLAKSTSMLNPAAEGKVIKKDFDGTDIVSCSLPSDQIKLCYTPAKPIGNEALACKNNIINFCAGPDCTSEKNVSLGGVPARSSYNPILQRTCIEVLIPEAGWKALGCKYDKIILNNGVVPNPSCILSTSCMTDIQKHSKTFISVTGVAYTCFKQTIASIMNDDKLCFTRAASNSLPVFQKYMQNTVHVLLLMYTFLFGANIALGNARGLPDITMFVFKMLLVMYFSVGFNFSGQLSANGVFSLYEYGTQISNGFANIVLSNGALQEGLCNIPAGDAYASGYEYLRLWDYLDCVLFFHFGMVLKASISYFINQLIDQLLSFIPVVGPILQVVSMILAFNQMLLITVIFTFFGMIFGAICSILEILMKSIATIALLTFIAPIFVPMLLFSATKSMFESWLNIYLGVLIQPAIALTYLPLMLTVFSSITFSECKFSSKLIDKPRLYTTVDSSTQAYVYYINPDTASADCKSSPGYVYAPHNSTVTFEIRKGFIYDWQELITSVLKTLYAQGTLGPTIILFIFGYILNFVSSYAASLAADLTTGAVKLSEGLKSPAQKAGSFMSKASTAKAGAKNAAGKLGLRSLRDGIKSRTRNTKVEQALDAKRKELSDRVLDKFSQVSEKADAKINDIKKDIPIIGDKKGEDE